MNHIVFKFIAILLCAASLLGAVGSVTGILALTEYDLYSKSVEQIKEERVQEFTAHYADTLALMYASTTLGGTPEQMVQDMTTYRGFEQAYGTFGYTIQDAEGNVLSSYNPELAEDSNVSAFPYPVTGQYMHLVSLESESEMAAREAAAQGVRNDGEFPENYKLSKIPAEGIPLTHVIFLDQYENPIYEATCYDYEYNVTYHYGSSSSSYGYGDNITQTGFLFCNQYGYVNYISTEREDYEPLPDTEIYEARFYNDDLEFRYQFAGTNFSIGDLTQENGIVRFQSSFPLITAVLETEPVTEPTIVEETIPETTAETAETVPATEATMPVHENGNPIWTEEPAEETAAPETAAAEETVPAVIVEETISSSASDIPAETGAEAVPAETSAEAAETVEAVDAAEGVTEPIPVETMPAETLPLETIPVETMPVETIPEETITEETIPEETEPVLINGKPLSDYQVNTYQYYDSDLQEWMTAKYIYVPMPELEVTVYVDKDTMRNAAMYDLLASIRAVCNYLLPTVGICLLVFAIFAVYLCTAAGRKPKTDEVRAGGLNRIPLDLYLFGGGFAIAACIAFCGEVAEYLLRQDLMVGYATVAGLIFLACLIFVAFCFAFVAQIKTPGGFWWRNSLCGICIRAFMRFAQWLETFLATKGFPALGRMCKKLWHLTVKGVVWTYHLWEKCGIWLISTLSRIFRWIGGRLQRFFAMIPLTWQWIVCGMALFCMILIAANCRSVFLIWICLIGSFALIFYGSHCFGALLESTKKMGRGDLNTKVDDMLMIGSFKEFAGALNDLAGVAVVAAQKQLKSERMKTELITNVSHDIKTPLTSIINYVDLLQKPHTEEEEAQYLEVLDRQSQRLKKLIDDLMDMSKASTGNMAVDIEMVDAVESVNQALGEFADKLDRAHLIPVFRHDDPQVPMMADGRLVWRVLSNLLSNAVKYAMPGTRLYIDLMTLEGKVVLSLKNISRDELNVDADELMERFVRGDDSRNTEGSGLGLNIAKSLMELQKGQLQLLVDGDLFKVTLIFPGA